MTEAEANPPSNDRKDDWEPPADVPPQPKPSPNERAQRTLAIISGKGGSGKTMISSLIARILADVTPVILVDGDIGTGGLSYYLGLKLVRNIAVGLADLLKEPELVVEPLLQDVHWDARVPKNMVQFLSIGDHWRLYMEGTDQSFAPRLLSVLKQIQTQTDAGYIIVDCRGGIDSESLSVCDAADDIILIVEPDTTAFQASQHAVNVLSRHGFAKKLRGFIINKVFDDPGVVARTGSSAFKCRCLAALPFDLDSTRDFFVGNVPSLYRQFGIQVWTAVEMAYPKIAGELGPPLGRRWSYEEFSQVSVTSPDSIRGGLVAAALLLIVGFISVLWLLPYHYIYTWNPFLLVLISFMGLGIAGSLEPTRRFLGRILTLYVRALSVILGVKQQR